MTEEQDLLVFTDPCDYGIAKCPLSGHWAPVDTDLDGPYYACWTNPVTFQHVEYSEGTITRTTFDNAGEYSAFLRYRLTNFGPFVAIDPCDSEPIRSRFNELGCAGLLRPALP